MNREVNLTKRVQKPHGWRYCTVVLSANGRVKADLVLGSGVRKPAQNCSGGGPVKIGLLDFHTWR